MAASLIGAVNAVVNFRPAPAEIVHVLQDCGARLVVVGAEFVPILSEIRDRLPALRDIVVLGGDGDEYEAWLHACQPLREPDDAAAEDCFLQLYTSGTTGRPQGAMLPQRGMVAHTRLAVSGYEMNQASVNVVPMPLFHVGGTSWALGSMSAGGRTIVVREIDPNALLDLIESRAATHAFLVPAMIRMLLTDPDRARTTLRSMKVLAYGGSPMPAPLMNRVLETLPVPLYSAYGMTELSGVFCKLGPAEHRDGQRPHLRTSAGRPLPGRCAGGRPRHRRGRRAGRGRRVLGAFGAGDGRLLEHARSDQGHAHPGRLAAYW